MCSNYIPAPHAIFTTCLEWPEPTFDYPLECYVGYRAPILLKAPDTQQNELRAAQFGLVPFWSKDTKIARHTYNARSETVSSKPSFRDPWKKRRFALVPMLGFYEPDYATGKAVRWRIERQDRQAFTVAAIWDCWRNPEGMVLTSFSLLTINADGHPLMGRFHGPGDEKRSLVVVPSVRHEAWLNADPRDASDFLREIAVDEFTSCPDPRPPRKRASD